MKKQKRAPQLQKLLAYLNSGKSVTRELARNRFGVQNLTARVWELRLGGAPVVTKYRTRDGRTQTFYVIESNQATA